jgi:hypothetical protein
MFLQTFVLKNRIIWCHSPETQNISLAVGSDDAAVVYTLKVLNYYFIILFTNIVIYKIHGKYIKIVNYFVASFRYFSIYSAKYTIQQT